MSYYQYCNCRTSSNFCRGQCLQNVQLTERAARAEYFPAEDWSVPRYRQYQHLQVHQLEPIRSRSSGYQNALAIGNVPSHQRTSSRSTTSNIVYNIILPSPMASSCSRCEKKDKKNEEGRKLQLGKLSVSATDQDKKRNAEFGDEDTHDLNISDIQQYSQNSDSTQSTQSVGPPEEMISDSDVGERTMMTEECRSLMAGSQPEFPEQTVGLSRLSYIWSYISSRIKLFMGLLFVFVFGTSQGYPRNFREHMSYQMNRLRGLIAQNLMPNHNEEVYESDDETYLYN